jgi:antitoxin VapB
MGLNIKNERTHQLIRELAALEGVSMVAAVTQAVQEKLERERAERERAQGERTRRRAQLLQEFADQCAPLFKDGRSSQELIDELYDPVMGLPR